MNRIFGNHPALCAFLLGIGAFLALYFGFKLWQPEQSVTFRELDTDLFVAAHWLLFGLGVVLWLTGGIIFGRDRGLNWFLSLLIHLIPVVGILAIAVFKRPLTPHEAWARDNPGLDDTTARRTYRPMKPLY